MYGQGMYGPGPMYGPMYGYPKAEGPYPPGLREPAPIKFTEGKLFIGGVDAHIITKDELVAYCKRWGDVADAVVMDKKNYGFVTFADPKMAMTFLETRVHELKGRRLDAKAAVPKAHLGNAKLTKKMFVGGTGDLTDDDFREHFAQFGSIEDAAVVRREGMSRGFGFVTFTDEISVEKCLLVNHYIKGRKVELKRAVPKEDLGGPSSAAMGPHPASGMVPAGYHPMPHPQQMYGPYPPPYGPAPGHHPPQYGMRPPPGAAPQYAAAPPGAAMPPGMPADPYAAWYAMGYVPYYHPAAGMPYGPYAQLMPQPGMPYAGAVPYMAAPAAVAGTRPPSALGAAPHSSPRAGQHMQHSQQQQQHSSSSHPGVQEEAPFVQGHGSRPAGAAGAGPPSGPGRPAGSSGAASPASTPAAGETAGGAPGPGGDGGRPGSQAGRQQQHSYLPHPALQQPQQLQPHQYEAAHGMSPAGPEAAAAAAAAAAVAGSSSPSMLEAQQQQQRSSAAQVMMPLMHPHGTSPAAVRRGPVLMPGFPVMAPAGLMPGVQQLPMHARAGLQMQPVLQQPQQLPPGTVLPAGFVLQQQQQQQQQQRGCQGSGDAPGSGSQS